MKKPSQRFKKAKAKVSLFSFYLVLTTAIILTSCDLQSLFAQIPIFSEDFDNIEGPTAGGPGTYVFPAGWMLVNVDNRAPSSQVAYVNEAWERRENFVNSVGDSCAFSTSWYVPAGPADDWMWTPPVTLTNNNELRWNAFAPDPAFQDGYEVRIMVAPNVPTGSTGVIGNMVSNSTVIFSTAAENSSWTARSVDLSAYQGQTVRIAFRNNSNDKFLLLIDDVEIIQVNDYDAQMLSTEPATEYTMTPLAQVSAYPLSGVIQNSGINELTQVKMDVQVYDSSNGLVQSSSSAVLPSLAASTSDNFNAGTFTPATADTFQILFIATHALSDANPANDTMRQTLIITENEYARDRGNITGALGIGAGNGGYVGQDFLFTNTAMISDIKMAVTRGYVGRQVAVLVWNMTGMPPAPDQVVASTDTLLYDSDDADTLLLPMSGGLTNLPAGRYAFTAIEFDSVLQIAQTDEIFTFSTGWIIWPTSPFGTWANPEDFGQNFAKPFVIRPILSGGETWYLDADNDGWYAATQFVTESPGPGWTNVPPVNGGGDCDDSDPDEFPGQTWYIDADNDGYSNSSVIQCERPANGFLISEISGTSDCADNDPAIHPAAMEICDGMDNNCDAIIDDQIPSGSSYYIPISLNNPGDPQMNYQVPVEINSLNLINAGHMQADGDDIRFAPINSCEGPFLDYFIESGINTTNTLIWVKIPMLPSGNSTVYLYYGDTEAEAGSNFNATFPNALITNGTNNTLSGTQNYDWLELSAGDTIFITPGSPLVMNARRAIIDGVVWGKGRGYAASGLSMSGAGPGGGALSTFGTGGGAGGGAYGGAGGTGGIDPGDTPSVGGTAYGTANGMDIDMGSAGGSSDSSPGGNGGGSFTLQASRIDFNGLISVDGQDGQQPGGARGGGGGAGGGVLLMGDKINLNSGSSITANGGNGSVGINPSNDSGGGGGGGRVKVFYQSTLDNSGSISVAGGTGGPNGTQAPGQPGSIGTEHSEMAALIAVVVNNGSETNSGCTGGQIDNDMDGYGFCTDCDDNNPNVNPSTAPAQTNVVYHNQNSVTVYWSTIAGSTNYGIRYRLQGSNDPWIEATSLRAWRRIYSLAACTSYEVQFRNYKNGQWNCWSLNYHFTTPCTKTFGSGKGLDAGLQVFPNPVSDVLNIVLNESMLDKAVTMTLRDQLGREVWNRKIQNLETTLVELNVHKHNLSAGVYMLSLQNENGVTTQQVVVSR